MTDQEIIKIWRSGISKNKLAKIYKREYNKQIKIIRSTVRHRNDGKFLINYEALRKIKLIILKYYKSQEE